MALHCASVFLAQKIADKTELSIYRFYSMKDTNRAELGIYSLEGGRLRPTWHGSVTLQNPRTEVDLLADLQGFSTFVMQETGYITPEVRDRQPGLLLDIHPEQATYLEMTRSASQTEVEGNPELYPQAR